MALPSLKNDEYFDFCLDLPFLVAACFLFICSIHSRLHAWDKEFSHLTLDLVHVIQMSDTVGHYAALIHANNTHNLYILAT